MQYLCVRSSQKKSNQKEVKPVGFKEGFKVGFNVGFFVGLVVGFTKIKRMSKIFKLLTGMECKTKDLAMTEQTHVVSTSRN